jgi:hypothetical protein
MARRACASFSYLTLLSYRVENSLFGYLEIFSKVL